MAVVRDLREVWAAAGPEGIERFEADVVAGFVLARAAAGLSDGTIRGDVSHLEQVRSWFGRPLWEMQPGDADAYFGTVLRAAAAGAGAGGEDVFRVCGVAAQGRDPSDDWSGGGVPD